MRAISHRLFAGVNSGRQGPIAAVRRRIYRVVTTPVSAAVPGEHSHAVPEFCRNQSSPVVLGHALMSTGASS